MKIDLRRIPAEGLELTETCSPADLDLESSEIKYTSPLEISAKITLYGNTANVDAQVKATLSLRCSRCLEEFNREIVKDYRFNYPIESDSQFADISEDVRQELILGYAVKILCKDDCKGLCPNCGGNLNKGKCKCQMKTQLSDPDASLQERKSRSH